MECSLWIPYRRLGILQPRHSRYNSLLVVTAPGQQGTHRLLYFRTTQHQAGLENKIILVKSMFKQLLDRFGNSTKNKCDI